MQSPTDKFTAGYKKTIRGIKYAFYKHDKFRRPMFFVEHEELRKLYHDTHEMVDHEDGEIEIQTHPISLFKNRDGIMILILSNAQGQVTCTDITASLYNNAIRFYPLKEIDWQ